MQLSVSTKAMNLLRHVLMTDGKKIQQNGQEVFSPRTLNGFESAQRRHFFKKTDEILEKLNEELQAKQKVHNEMVKALREKLSKETEKLEGEVDNKFKVRVEELVKADQGVKDSITALNELVKTTSNTKQEIELTDATGEVVKKYFTVYGDEAGFGQDLDEAVEEVVEVLK